MRALLLCLLVLTGCKPDPKELEAALQRGDLAEVQRLLAEGADPNAVVVVDQASRRPLGVAAVRGDLPLLEALLARRADPTLEDPGLDGGRTPLAVAAFRGHAKVVARLLAAGARVDHGGGAMTPLALAAQNGDLATVEALLAARAVVDPSRDATGYPPLTVAADHGHLDVVKRLVEAGAPVDRRDILGGTALFYTAVKGHREMAEYLLARGASPMVPNRAGWTPAFAATYNGEMAIRELFEKAGVTDWDLQVPPKDPPSGLGTVTIPVVDVEAPR